jgi:hypothetical protein
MADGDVLVETGAALLLRLNGRPRNPESGCHREVVVFSAVTLPPRDLARRLRDAADRLPAGYRGNVETTP